MTVDTPCFIDIQKYILHFCIENSSFVKWREIDGKTERKTVREAGGLVST